jgi:hypothetical protein
VSAEAAVAGSGQGGRRWLVLLLIGGILLLPAALILGPSAGSDRSTLDRSPTGTAALAGVLRRLDHEVESLRVGLIPLIRKPAGSVLFMPSEPGLIPSTVLTEHDVELLERFMTEGSTLVIATHYPNLALDSWDVTYEWDALEKRGRDAPGPRWTEALPVLPEPIALGGSLALKGRGGLEAPGAQVLYAVGSVPVVVRKPMGRGQLIVVADPTTISNSGLGRAGNLEFWTQLVGVHLRDGGVVLFDDLHAGAMDDHGVVAYARRSGMVPAMLLVLFLAGLYLWRAGSRLGGLLPALDARNPRASTEIIHAVAGLYGRARLRSHALAVISRRFRRRMERRSGLPWERKLLDPWVQQELGSEAARVFARIRRGFAALLPDPDPDRDSTLELARLVHRFEQTWLTTRRRTDLHGKTERPKK